MAIHPWPDIELRQSDVAELFTELLPRHNANLRSVTEIAIDRLLRIANCLENLEFRDVADEFAAASRHLGENRADDLIPAGLKEAIKNPIGVDPGALVASPAVAGSQQQNTLTIRNKLQQTVAQMFGAAESTGLFDIGELFGGKATGIDVAAIADILEVESPLVLFDQFVDSLDTRKQDIFVSRICKPLDPDTLLTIAERWGVTRERIRQAETKTKELAVEEIGRPFRRFAIPFFKPYRGKIVKFKHIGVAVRSLTAGAKWADAASGFALASTGKWKRRSGWILFNQDKCNHERLQDLLTKHLDDFDVASRDLLDTALNSYFQDDNDRDSYLAKELNTILVGNYWCRSTQSARAIAAVRMLGKPSTKEEISKLMDGYPINRVGSLLSSIDCIVRADKYRWGISDWIEDEYTGIVEEIGQRIDENGGSVAFNSLISELPEKFAISEVSVRAYISSEAFTVLDGYVYYADINDFTARKPQSVKGGVESSFGWGQLVELKAHHFTGHSLGVSFDLAYANGIRPNDSLVVPIFDTSFEGSVIWRSTTVNRTVDVGRASTAIKRLGFRIGAKVVVIPLADKIVFQRPDECYPYTEPNQKVDSLESSTAPEHEFIDPLFGLLE